MKQLQRIRFIRAWQTYSVGNVIEPPGTLRDWLVANGYCELVAPVAAIAPAAPAGEPVTAARRRGRPRKNLAVQG